MAHPRIALVSRRFKDYWWYRALAIDSRTTESGEQLKVAFPGQADTVVQPAQRYQLSLL